MNQPLVSICVPTCNLGQYSIPYLRQCLESLVAQDYPNIEVSISDHSIDDLVFNTVGEFDRLRITYARLSEHHGSAVVNLNSAITRSSGELIKPLFQDDYLASPSAISQMVGAILNSGRSWCGVGCRHVDENDVDLNYYHPPGWIDTLEMAYGINLLGSPSVMMWRRDMDVMMDHNLKFLNDCELYYRYGKKHGPPALVMNTLVTIRMRKDGISAQSDIGEIKNKEHRYLDVKYPH